MKRAAVILLLSTAVGVFVYCGTYYTGTESRRSLLESGEPELAWLRREFKLSDAELSRISKLHAAYQPHCRQMCARIDEQNQKLEQLLAATNTVTPEIEQAIAAAAKLRGECQRDMLQHFFEVSQTMPAAQGRRYLDWVQRRTFLTVERETSQR